MILDLAFQWLHDAAIAGINTIHGPLTESPLPYPFIAGMLASVNPCGFIMLPAYAAFCSTGSPADAGKVRQIARAASMGLLVATSFIGVFLAVGVVVTMGGGAVMAWSSAAGLAAGVILTAFGVMQLIGHARVLQRWTARIRVRRRRSASGALAFGIGYAACSLGCTLPAFLVVAGTVFLGERDVLHSLTRFVAFGLGMGTVMIFVSVATAMSQQSAIRMGRPLAAFTELASNAALIVFGLYIVWFWSTRGT